MMTRSTWFLCVASCLALALWTTGCSKNSVQQGPPSCTKTTDCAAGLVCSNHQCLTIPCGGRCTSDQVCLNDACHSANGLDCSMNADICPKDTFTCAEGKCRRTCTMDSDCPKPLVCNLDLFGGLCAECSSDRECQTRPDADPTRTICDTTVGACVGCLENTTCYDHGKPNAMYCDSSSQSCQPGCLSVADCPMGTKTCLGAMPGVAGKCIMCSADTDCVNSNAAHCDKATNLCVQCLSNDECPSNQCDTKGHKCVDCVSDLACMRGQVCDQSSFTCTTGCSGGSGQATCPPATPVCDPSKGKFGTCVICLQDSDCPQGQICDPTGNAGQPVCVPGCHSDVKCPPADDTTMTHSICDTGRGAHGTCVQCRSDQDCDQGLICDTTTESCRCKGIGEPCSSDSDCGYVPSLTNTTKGCSDAERQAHHAFCVQDVQCHVSGMTYTKMTGASVCVMSGSVITGMSQGFPSAMPPDTTGCPSGFAVENATDGTQPYTAVCVPNQTQYVCP